MAEVETVLARLQRIEPAGLFARDLAECLVLQAREAEVLDAPMSVMLGRLDLVDAGDWGQLARLAGVRRERSSDDSAPSAASTPSRAPLFR